MTTIELLTTIKAEIKRRIRNETTNASYLELGRIQGNNTLAEHLLSFIDTLEASEGMYKID